MKKFRYGLLAIIGLSGAALIGTAPDAPKDCGCSLKPKMENGILRSFAKVRSVILQGRAWVNKINNRDGTSSSTCTAFLYNGLRWNTEKAIVRYAPVTVAQSVTEIA